MLRSGMVLSMTDKTTPTQLQQKLQDLLTTAPPAEWVSKMVEHYRRTGTYRPEDLRRLLGDPTKGVEVGPKACLAALLAEQGKH